MNRSRMIWIGVLLMAGVYLAARAMSGNMGQVYVKEVVKKGKDSEKTWTRYTVTDPQNQADDDVTLSWPRTIGLWVAAFLTLSILSFLYGDNVFYRLAEAIFVGVSAAYVMVVAFWTGICQNLFGKLAPDFMRDTVLPGLPETEEQQLIYIIPLILSVLMLMRLSPKGSWISRWPLAFFIGATAGFRMVAFFESDFVRQIQNSIMPLVVVDGGFHLWQTLKNLTIFVGVMSALVYFFFSVEHTGIPGKVSRLGIWFLMIAFGASFGYTVMGRIALLAQRIEFLLDDWLWFIDPLNRRVGM